MKINLLYAIANKYPKIDNGKLKFVDTAGDVTCSNGVTVTEAPTNAFTPIRTVSRTSKVNIQQTSDYQLHVTKAENNGFSSVFIEKEFDYGLF